MGGALYAATPLRRSADDPANRRALSSAGDAPDDGADARADTALLHIAFRAGRGLTRDAGGLDVIRLAVHDDAIEPDRY